MDGCSCICVNAHFKYSIGENITRNLLLIIKKYHNNFVLVNVTNRSGFKTFKTINYCNVCILRENVDNVCTQKHGEHTNTTFEESAYTHSAPMFQLQ